MIGSLSNSRLERTVGLRRPAAQSQGRYADSARIFSSTFYNSGVKVAEVIRMLEKDGWILTRTRGSHRQYKHPSKPGLVTLAGKPSADVPRGTLNSILKQAQLKGDS